MSTSSFDQTDNNQMQRYYRLREKAEKIRDNPSKRNRLELFLRRLRQHALKIAIWIFFLEFVSLVYILNSTPQYLSTAQIVLEPRRKFGSTVDQSSNNVGQTLDSGQAESQTQVIKSERNLKFVFETLELYNNQEYMQSRPTIVNWLMSVLKLNVASSDITENRVAQISAYQAFVSRVDVRRLGQSYVLEVSFRSNSPASAAKITNSIAAAYLRDQIEASAAAVQRGTEFLQNRIANINLELETVTEAVKTGTVPTVQFVYSDARIISAAIEPITKSSPRTIPILLATFVAAVASSFIYILFKVTFDRTIVNKNSLVEIMDGFCIDIPYSKALASWSNKNIFASSNAEMLEKTHVNRLHRMRELYRFLRGATQPNRRQAIAIISVSSGSGGSTFTIELSKFLNNQGESTTIIDANFYNPKISRLFFPGAAVGFREVMSGKQSLYSTVSIVNPKTSLIPAYGSTQTLHGYSNTIVDYSLKSDIDELKNSSFIIFDVGVVSHNEKSLDILSLVDVVVLITEAEKTEISDLLEVIKFIEWPIANPLAVVLNKSHI